MNDIDFDELDRAVEELMVKRKAGKSAKAAVSVANKSTTAPAVNSVVVDEVSDPIVYEPIVPVSNRFNLGLEDQDDTAPSDQFKIELKNKDVLDKSVPDAAISHPLEVKTTPVEAIEDYLKASRARQEKSLAVIKDEVETPSVELKINSNLERQPDDSLFASRQKFRLEPTGSLADTPVNDEVKVEPPAPEPEMSTSDQLINSFDSEELDAKFIDQIDDDELEEQDFDFLEEDDQVELVKQLDTNQSPHKSINDSVKNDLSLKTKAPIKSTVRGRFMDIVSSDLTTGATGSAARESVARLAKAKRFAASMNSRTTTKISDFAPRVKSGAESLITNSKFEVEKDLDQTEPSTAVQQVSQVDDTIRINSVNLEPASDSVLEIQIPEIAKESAPEEIIVVKDDSRPEADTTRTDLRDTELATSDVTDQELDEILAGQRSPFIPKAKVDKRPLGSPDQFHMVPNVTMNVPDYVSQSTSEGSTALYRAELHKPEDKKSKLSGLGLIIMVIGLLLVAGLLIYFADDISARLL